MCVTKENLDRPWLRFEAGALLKRVSKNRVCTFLVDLKYADVKDPLAQFNHTVYDREDVYKLVKTINDSMESGGLEDARLKKVFETNWPEFETRFDAILESNAALQTQPDKPQRSPDDVMVEILENTRQLNKRVGALENLLDCDTQHHINNSPSVALDMIRVKSKNKRSYIRYRQTYGGLEVFGAETIVKVNASGGIESVSSDIMVDTAILDQGRISLNPTLDAAAAQTQAMTFLADQHDKLSFEADEAVLKVFSPAVVGLGGGDTLGVADQNPKYRRTTSYRVSAD